MKTKQQQAEGWTLDEFVSIANQAMPQTDAALMEDERFKSEMTPRNIRRLAAEGAIDAPDRFGREARYQPRHLEQLIEARALMARGFSCSAIRALRASPQTTATGSVLETVQHSNAYFTSASSMDTVGEEPLFGASALSSSNFDTGSAHTATAVMPSSKGSSLADFTASDLPHLADLGVHGAMGLFASPAPTPMTAADKALAFLNGISANNDHLKASQPLTLAAQAPSFAGHKDPLSSSFSRSLGNEPLARHYAKSAPISPSNSPLQKLHRSTSTADPMLSLYPSNRPELGESDGVLPQSPPSTVFSTVELEPMPGVRISIRSDAPLGVLTDDLKAQALVAFENAWEQARRQRLNPLS